MSESARHGETPPLKAGDPIWYAQTCRGGYGFMRDVPGEYVRSTAKRVTVLLHRRSGDPVQVAVHPRHVRRRYLETLPAPPPETT